MARTGLQNIKHLTFLHNCQTDMQAKNNRSFLGGLLLIALWALMSPAAHAQGRTYTVIQAGGLFGLSTTSAHSPMHGYQVQLSFGRNFQDRVYAGIGLSQDIYRGTSTLADGKRSTRRINTLPIFAEARVPLANIGVLGSLGAGVQAGYAPPMGAEYFGGFTGKAGISYGQMLADRSDLLFSLGYGFQRFDSRFSMAPFSQHNAFISVGLFVR